MHTGVCMCDTHSSIWHTREGFGTPPGRERPSTRREGRGAEAVGTPRVAGRGAEQAVPVPAGLRAPYLPAALGQDSPQGAPSADKAPAHLSPSDIDI